MATVTELKAVLKDTLEKKGVLGNLRARIRAEVFNALDDDGEPRPSLSHENLLINELIREYLEFNKYKYTTSVLIADDHLRKEEGRSTDIEDLRISQAVNR
uniref:Centrosomal protein 20 n=1 Tax=Prolemur simus TaxID=1328070 RepID=A0A8C9DLR0_PROSS